MFDSTVYEFTWQSSTPANEQLIQPIACTQDRERKREASEVYATGNPGKKGTGREGEKAKRNRSLPVTARTRRRWCCALPRLARRVRIIVIYCLAAVFS